MTTVRESARLFFVFGKAVGAGQKSLFLAVFLLFVAVEHGYGLEMPDLGGVAEIADPHLQLSPWNVFGNIGVQSRVFMNTKTPTASNHVMYSQTQVSRSGMGYFIEPYISRWRSDFNAGLALSKTLTLDSAQDSGFTQISAPDMQSNLELGIFPQSRFPVSLYFNRSDRANSEGGSAGRGSAQVSQKFGLKQDFQSESNDLTASIQGEHRNDNMGERARPKLQTFLIPGISSGEGTNVSNMLNLRIDRRFAQNTLGITARHSDNTRTTSRTASNNREQGIVVTHSFSPKENLSANNLLTAGIMNNHHLTKGSGFVNQGDLRERASSNIQQISTDVFWRAAERPLSISGSVRVAQEEESSFLDLTDSNYEMDRNHQGINARFGGMYRLDERNTLSGFLTGDHDLTEQTSTQANSTTSLDGTNQAISHQFNSEPSTWGPFEHRWYSGASLSSSAADRTKPSQSFLERLGHGLRRRFAQSGEAKGGAFQVSLDESVGLTEKLPKFETGIDLTHSMGVGYDIGADDSPTLIDLRLTDTRALSPEATESQLANFQVSRSSAGNDSGRWQGSLTVNWVRTCAPDCIETLSPSAGAGVTVSKVGLFGVEDLRNNLSTAMTTTVVSMGKDRPALHELSVQNLLYYRIGKLSARFGGELTILGDDDGIKDAIGLITLEVTREFHRRF